MIFKAKDAGVRQNMPLSIQEKSIHSVAGFHLLHVVRSHGVQKARAILACYTNPSASRKIQQRRSVLQRVVPGSRTLRHRVTIIE
jgi:hypothetical protein